MGLRRTVSAQQDGFPSLRDRRETEPVVELERGHVHLGPVQALSWGAKLRARQKGERDSVGQDPQRAAGICEVRKRGARNEATLDPTVKPGCWSETRVPGSRKERRLTDYARTLHVVHDSHGERVTESGREAVEECTTEHYPQYPD